MLESAGGATFGASLAAARRVTGRVVVYGVAGGDASVTNWDLVYRHQVQLVGFNLGVLIRSAPRIFAEVMAELFALIAAGAWCPGDPTTYDLVEGPKRSRSWRTGPPSASSRCCPDDETAGTTHR